MSDERNEAEPIELGYIEDLGDMISVQEGSTVDWLQCIRQSDEGRMT